jgi:uncharacterized protein (TIGR03435 family)
MVRSFLISCLAAFPAGAAFAQPAFEVASIHPSSQEPNEQVSIGIHVDGSQVRVVRYALKDYLAWAYRVKPYQISGPDWLATARFDILATLPDGSTTAQIPEMLQKLMAERFQVKLHRDKKEFPVYVLELGKGPLKLQASPLAPDDGDTGKARDIAGSGSSQGVAVNLGRGASYTFANNRFEATKLSMADMAASLERFLDRPIVDMTDITGTYDFALDLTDEDYRLMLIRAGVNAGVSLPPQALRLLEGGSPVSLFDAAQKLGLKLDARKAPLEVLVIDELRKTPTEN